MQQDHAPHATPDLPAWVLFHDRIPRFLLCAEKPSDGSWRAPRVRAIRQRYIDPRQPKAFGNIVLDVDRKGADRAHEDAHLPPPNAVITSPTTHHAHVLYVLQTSVACHEVARTKPLKYFAAVERGLTRRLTADVGYAGALMQNPLHNHWQTEWLVGRPYNLADIAASLEQADMRLPSKSERASAAERNVRTFDLLRWWAYKNVRDARRAVSFETWRARVLAAGLAINAAHNAPPLPAREVGHTAASVAKWTWRRYDQKYVEGKRRAEPLYTDEDRQRALEVKRKRMVERRKATAGLTVHEAAKAAGVSLRTAYLDRAAPKPPKELLPDTDCTGFTLSASADRAARIREAHRIATAACTKPNVSEIAKLFGVSRPTVYAAFKGEAVE